MKRDIFTIALVCVLGVTTQVRAQEDIVDLTSGKAMYIAWCAKCHGEDGKGHVEGLEIDVPLPDFTDCNFNSSETRNDWKAVVAHGGPARGLSWGMPSWGEAIDDEQVGLVVDYIKSLCPEQNWPPGELNFRRLQVTEKAFLEDEALLVPMYTHSNTQRSSTTKFEYESRLGARGQWELSVPFESDYNAPARGIGDIELSGKYALYDNLHSLSIISAGLEVGIPTGSQAKGFGSGEWMVAPFLAGGRGFGNLLVQSSVTYETTVKGEESELQYNLAFTYQLSDEKSGLAPALELNGIKSLVDGTNNLFLTPQLFFGLSKRGHLAMSLGAQIPVAGPKPFDYRVVAFFLWEYNEGGLWW